MNSEKMVAEERKNVKDKNLPDDFQTHLSFITANLKGSCKVNDIYIGKLYNIDDVTKIIVFNIEGENYVTCEDAKVLLEHFLIFKKKKFKGCLYRWIKEQIPQKSIIEIDPSFENEEIKVLKLNELDNDVYNSIMAKCIDQREIKEEYEFKDITNNENIDFYSNLNIDEEKRMFSDLIVTDEQTKYLEPSPTDLESINTTSTMNELEGLQNIQTKVEMENVNEFQPFAKDWTNEMVDSIIGNMFDQRSFESQNDNFSGYMNQTDYDPEFSDINNPMCKIDSSLTNTSRPFICHYRSCNRAFKRFEHLKRHYRIHTGERPFKCKFPGCHKAFARSDNLNQHLRVHNNGSAPVNHRNVGRNYRYIDDDN